MPAAHAVATRHRSLHQRGCEKDDENRQRVAQQCVKESRGVKPAFGWTSVGHPVVTCERERQQGKHPKQEHGVGARKLSFRCGKDRENPPLVLRQFGHPTQFFKMGIETNHIVVDVVGGWSNLP